MKVKPLEQAKQIILEKIPEVVAIYRFGTFATADERPDSDLDLAVFRVTKIPPLMLWEVAQQIAQAVRRDVDLVDLQQASTIFRFEIIRTGERIYCKNKYECDLFETYVYSSYVRFNEDRAGLLQDILRRGSVYGR